MKLVFNELTDVPQSLYGKWQFVGPDFDIDNKKIEIGTLKREFNKLLFKRRSKQKRQRIHAKLKKARVELAALQLAR